MLAYFLGPVSIPNIALIQCDVFYFAENNSILVFVFNKLAILIVTL